MTAMDSTGLFMDLLWTFFLESKKINVNLIYKHDS